ncbi:MAG: FAD-dependent oxidoreductase [Lysobacterales bacterium]
MTDNLSRRRVLSLLGAAAGISPFASMADAPTDTHWDLIIVGGGNAGLPAAIFAAERGAQVLIIDAASNLGGTLWLSSGQMSAAGTQLQASKGIEDTPQSHYDDIMRISKDTADPDIMGLAVFNAAETFDWLMDSGLEVHNEHPVTGTTHEPYSRARYVWGKDGGRSLLNVLEGQLKPHVEAGRVSLLMNTRVTDLIQTNDGAVTGVVTENAGGDSQHHSARQTLLTCGGYSANADMCKTLEGVRDYTDITYPFSQGAGITLSLSAGGYVRGGEHHLPLFGAVLADDVYPARMIATVRPWPPARPPWEIYVNVRGERFMREDIASHDAHEHALMEQPEERCWVVFDSAIFARAPQLVRGSFAGPWTQDDVRFAFDDGMKMFFKADSIEELANATQIDGDGLSATIADYNRGQNQGNDSFGREHLPLPIAKPPYYAIQLQGWLLTSFAGVAVDKQLRIIKKDGTPIPNLYAAGELLGNGQLMGRSYCGGMQVMPALTFGRLLGKRLLNFT